ncbi:MAG TPA: hypothetical protein VF699_11770 [Caulobacteraceae bacterium]|jgi:hypothetical protein
MNWTDARGSTSVIAAFALLGVAGATAAAVEMSRVTAAATALQDLADATALRTARADARGEQDKVALAAGAEALALSLMDEQAPDATGAQADVSFPEDPPAVTVRLSHKVGLFGQVSAVATAIEEPDAPVCLLVLDPAKAGSWSVGGSSVVAAEDCAAQVNSASARALSGGGAARVHMLRTLVVGRGGALRGFTPAPRYQQPLLADPYADQLPWPRPAHCDHTNLELKKGSESLQPGVYCGGLVLGSGAVADLSPGVYVLKDGPLKLASQSTLNAPAGVTFVLVGQGGFVETRAGADLKLKAPTSGPWTGFIVAQAPNGQQGQSSVVIGGGDVDVDGLMYLPSQHMMISGGGEGFLGGMVVNTLDMRGNGRLKLRPGIHAPVLPGTPRLEKPDDPPPPPPPG